MTDSTRGPSGPPWSVDLLADLHAGVLDEAESARLWPQVNADPEARAILDALDSVTADLGDFANAPVEPMPAQFAARLDQALAAEARARGPVTTAPPPRPVAPAPPSPPPPVAPVVDLAAARKRRNRIAAWSTGVLTAAAAAAAIAFVAIPDNTTDGTAAPGDTAENEQPSEGAAQPPVALSRDNLSPAIGEVSGENDYGALEDEDGLQQCLDSQGIDAPGDTIGVRPVTLDGTEGVAALLGAGRGQFLLVVVTPDCDETLAETELP
ncbi:hypothetical protein [Actinophytocola gossypii]|uniref:Anti-sigma factor n=1 Tax=Actinophytocola gossypii TaxID=2812003 RepID=A0ABT2JF57_9PSEU|nr:hypothetical protein [Actinophytocola gossypii]MCT2586514.1 hypothetical protein [Actinophytocola gossypii]